MTAKKLTKKQMEEFRQKLVEERGQLVHQERELEEGALSASQSELTGEMSFDEEFADAATATFERERDLSISNNIKDLLDKIDHALRRIEDGTYGICERCGKPIERARLRALPYANLCIEDAQAEERL